MQHSKIIFFTTVLLSLSVFWSGAQQIKVYAQVSSQDVYSGETFTYQIVIDGTNNVNEPDLSAVSGFKVQYRGGSPQNSQSITIINGKKTENISRRFIYQYRLTPQEKGLLTIPAISVRAEGKIYQTKAITIQVKEPADENNFKIRQSINRTAGFRGEQIIYTVTWLFQDNVR
ncbi:MAG: BatD family protein, partial [Spirochaetes bacterium]|nr:BatD family protein [Spirochaetota bacterium]